MPLFSKRDPFQPGAYVNTTRVLYEIVERDGDLVTLENVVTGWKHSRLVGDLLRTTTGGRPEYRLTKAAPEVPDLIPQPD